MGLTFTTKNKKLYFNNAPFTGIYQNKNYIAGVYSPPINVSFNDMGVSSPITYTASQQQMANNLISSVSKYGISAGQHQVESNDLGLNVASNGKVILYNYAIPSTYTKNVAPYSFTTSNKGLLAMMGYPNAVSITRTNVYDLPNGNPNIAPTQTLVSNPPPALFAGIDALLNDISSLLSQFAKDLSSLGSGLLSFFDFIAKWWWLILLGVGGAITGALYFSHKTRKAILSRLPIVGKGKSTPKASTPAEASTTPEINTTSPASTPSNKVETQ